jgi:hypothetical protein
MNEKQSGVFEMALKNQADISSSYSVQLGREIDVGGMLSFDGSTKSRVRQLMVDANSPTRFLFRLEERASRKAAEARELLASGQVAAVDGTNALNVISLMNTSAYACAVGHVTSRKRGDPHVKIVKSSTEYEKPEVIQDLGADALASLCDQLDEIRADESWPTTFREYQERREAIDCGAPFVFVDGPIFTQNLVTQPSGQSIYEEMAASGRCFIGVIKDLSGSWTLSKWCGYTLETGEGFVVCPVADQLKGRYKDAKKIQGFIEQPDINAFVRVVFRPSQKAFGFECRLADLDMAVALLMADASQTLGHELPLLLETIDAHLRAGFDGGFAADVVCGEIQRRDYRMGMDVIGERNFR